MFETLINQINTMSLGEELYTICFTVFVVAGVLCCFIRADKRSPARPTMPAGPKRNLAA